MNQNDNEQTSDYLTVRTGADDDLTVIELVWPRIGLTPHQLHRTLANLGIHIIASELHTVGGQLRERLRVCDSDGRLLHGERIGDVQRGLSRAIHTAQNLAVSAPEEALADRVA